MSPEQRCTGIFRQKKNSPNFLFISYFVKSVLQRVHNHLAKGKSAAVTRKRKLAAIRGFLKFLKDNQIIFGNPADTIEGPIREERDPAILLKTEYKALLQVAGGNTREFCNRHALSAIGVTRQ
jgi:site-specific recombinase XerD